MPINNERVVPVTATDLLSLYATVFAVAGKDVTILDGAAPTGAFTVTEGSGDLLANEPVSTLDFGEGVTSATLYFIPAYGFNGFTVAGEPVEAEGADELNADGATLYTATLAGGAVTIAPVVG